MGSGLKYGFSCLCSFGGFGSLTAFSLGTFGSSASSPTGDSFRDFLGGSATFVADDEVRDRGFLRPLAAASGTASDLDFGATERDRLGGGDEERSGDAARFLVTPFDFGAAAATFVVAAFETGLADAALDERLGGMVSRCKLMVVVVKGRQGRQNAIAGKYH